MTHPEVARDPVFHHLERGDLDALRRHLAAFPAAISAEDEQGARPLHIAARLDHTAAVELLLSVGADLEDRDRFHDSTPLAWAAYYGNLSVVQVLMSSGASRSAQNRYRLDPRQIAEGGARGEHAADCPDRSAAEFIAVAEWISAAR